MQGRVYTTSITILFGVSNNQNILITSVIETSLQELLKAVGEENGFSVDQCEVGEADHVHCFVSAPPNLSITFIVKHLKGVSGLRLFREYPELRQSLWHGQLWNGSYFVETIGSTSEENVRRYIDRQKNVQR
ncbi:IS200/IS605 family transposase [Galactobacillus timonensis]|uniref:IS200/IS605 family transposase n=1 Tax=Galactobacillus timonensis TaxID=2041840 RepID=UPI0024093B18|nr:IS200/IS605 family transposase [Galactobacillus timonensis]MDD6369370.1 IS200/IS605 family transposase [Galactobacillus timonensis]